jgi:hypothetical protein
VSLRDGIQRLRPLGRVSLEFSPPPVLVRRPSPIGAGEGRPNIDLARIGLGISPMNSGTLLAGTDGFLC